MNIKEMSNEYEPVEFKNISEFNKIAINLEITPKMVSFTDKKTKEVEEKELNFVNLTHEDGKEYEVRVPNKVLGQLKEQIKANPKMKFFSVAKSGEGLGTQYTVIPIME